MRLSLLASTLALLPVIATAEPGYFRVTGVAYDDTLNIRAEPNGSSADIGDLAYDARGVEIMSTDPSGKWGKIIHFEGNGWVAMRFLEPDAPATIGETTLPVGLQCSGTEPFWSAVYEAGSMNFSNMGDPDVPLLMAGAGAANGRWGFPALVTHSGSGGFTYSLIRPEICSDGMSDRDYPWSIDFIIDGGTYLSGCCNLPLDDM